jgi:hypothetical protein
MLRLESNTRAIDHNVIAQCSTNNGGMDFHVREYGSLMGDLQTHSIPTPHKQTYRPQQKPNRQRHDKTSANNKQRCPFCAINVQ